MDQREKKKIKKSGLFEMRRQIPTRCIPESSSTWTARELRLTSTDGYLHHLFLFLEVKLVLYNVFANNRLLFSTFSFLFEVDLQFQMP